MRSWRSEEERRLVLGYGKGFYIDSICDEVLAPKDERTPARV